MAISKAKVLISTCLLSVFFIQACGDKRPAEGLLNLGKDENSVVVTKEILRDRTNFDERFKKARALLDSTISGAEILNQLDKKNSYNEPIGVPPISPTELKEYNLSGLSGIRKRDKDGKYEIVINVDLSVDGIAHAIASGLELFKVAVDEDLYSRENPIVAEKLAQAHEALKKGTFSEYAAKNRSDAQFFLKGVYFAEMKAMEACGKLHEEKVSFPLKKKKGIELYDYIYETHIAPIADADAQFNASEFYNLILTEKFQKIRDLYAFFLSTK